MFYRDPDMAADDLADERAEAQWQRRRHSLLMRHPDCRDPDHPGCEACRDEDEAKRLIALVQKHTTPPAAQRQWVGLTDDEVAVLMMEAWGCASTAPQSAPKFASAIEAKLKEKNT